MPMVCQYQAVQSTTTCRSSMRRRKIRASIAPANASYANQQVQSVGAGNQVEEVAAGIGGKEHALRPPVASRRSTGRRETGAPRTTVAASQGAARRMVGRPRPSHSSITSISRKKCLRPISMVRLLRRIRAVLIHRIGGIAIGCQSMTQMLLASEMAAALAGEKGADQGDEEHQVAGQGKKQHHAVAAQQVSGSAAARWPILPIFAIPATTSWPAGYRRFAAKSWVFALCLNGGAGEGSRHGSNSDILKITPVLASGSHCILKTSSFE